jgi:putative NADH-flavin reductase
MKLVIFGANGATGQWLVRLAVERGHQVTAVMREGASASVPQGVDVVRGDPLDAAFVDRAVTGKDAVVTALGVRLRRGSNPFSSLVSPPTLLSQSAAHMLAAMKRHGVSRISMVSGAGVGDSRKS